MKTFALYIFHPDKQGFERYEYKYEIQLDHKEIPYWLLGQYKDRFDIDGKAYHLNARVKINDVWFNDMWTVANGGGQELVIAERIIK